MEVWLNPLVLCITDTETEEFETFFLLFFFPLSIKEIGPGNDHVLTAVCSFSNLDERTEI